MLGKRFAIIVCAFLCTGPVTARAQQGNPADASLACFFVLLESSYQHAVQCGRSFSGEELDRYGGIRSRMESYILVRGGSQATRSLATLRRQLERSAPSCQDSSARLSQQFLDEVIGDKDFPARLEENLARLPDPFAGGCL